MCVRFNIDASLLAVGLADGCTKVCRSVVNDGHCHFGLTYLLGLFQSLLSGQMGHLAVSTVGRNLHGWAVVESWRAG